MSHKKQKYTYFVKYLTDAEWEKIKNWIEKKYSSPSGRLAVYTMAWLGLRVGETITIKRSQFSNDFRYFDYTPLKKKAICKKTRIKRIVVPTCLQKKLQIYDEKYRGFYRCGYMLFPFRNKSRNLHIQRSTIEYLFKDIRKDMNLEDVYYIRENGNKMNSKNPLNRITPHTLRHYFALKFTIAASKVVGDALAIKATQERLDHEKLETTARYIHALLGTQSEAKVADLIDIR